uniref:Uncharacterized protein n=1 Tax=Solanum aethiopicum TaxID=205524 RepID=A0A7D7FVU3_SOLAE|nr:hypothetical protein [Solanum aethiopicum]QMQ97684.1 hypothetical protein [Solanum aethiopicum]WMB96681.1 hypothetical protein [Solanum melongena]WMB96857.1 hypothetical protein [Solanum melongena]WMB97144.1 hypothetical protein [Solanum aethiopicum]
MRRDPYAQLVEDAQQKTLKIQGVIDELEEETSSMDNVDEIIRKFSNKRRTQSSTTTKERDRSHLGQMGILGIGKGGRDERASLVGGKGKNIRAKQARQGMMKSSHQDCLSRSIDQHFPLCDS